MATGWLQLQPAVAMKHFYRFSIFVCGLSCVGFASASSLLKNGGFETNTRNTGFLYWWGDVADDWRPVSSPDMWDDTGVAGNVPGYDSVSMVGAHAHSGNRFAGMASKQSINFYEGLVGNLNQVLTVGESYTLSLWLYADTDYSFTPGFAPIRVSWANTEIGWLAQNTVRNEWQYRELVFTATQEMAVPNGQITMQAFGTGNVYLGLDDVGLAKTQPVPEPMTCAALGLGLLPFVRRRWRAGQSGK